MTTLSDSDMVRQRFWAVVNASNSTPTLFHSEKAAERAAKRWRGYHPEEKHRCVLVELTEVEE